MRGSHTLVFVSACAVYVAVFLESRTIIKHKHFVIKMVLLLNSFC